jgi:putative endonuclease
MTPVPHPGSQSPLVERRRAEQAERAERRRSLGAFGEAYAARQLSESGMVVLDRNWRCEDGEVDLVLRDGPVLVVCEVKTRSSTAYGSPLEGVTARKAARLRRLAARWLAEHQVRPDEVRIDMVGVLAAPGREPLVEHVRGIG